MHDLNAGLSTLYHYLRGCLDSKEFNLKTSPRGQRSHASVDLAVNYTRMAFNLVHNLGISILSFC